MFKVFISSTIAGELKFHCNNVSVNIAKTFIRVLINSQVNYVLKFAENLFFNFLVCALLRHDSHQSRLGLISSTTPFVATNITNFLNILKVLHILHIYIFCIQINFVFTLEIIPGISNAWHQSIREITVVLQILFYQYEMLFVL